jgi:hypothetical protein
MKRNAEIGLFTKPSIFPEINVDNADLGGVADQLQGAVDAQFPHDAGAVVFDGFGADEQTLPDVFHGMAFRQESEDFLRGA